MDTKDNNSTPIVKLAENLLTDLNRRINRLSAIETSDHKNEIQFLTQLNNSITSLNHCFSQAMQKLPIIQNEMELNWDKLIDQKLEYENKKKESEEKKKELISTQVEENTHQLEKKRFSKQLKKEESDLLRDQKRFNRTGKRLDGLYARLEEISNIKTDPDNNALSTMFKSYNHMQVKRINRRIADQNQNKTNLSEQIQENQNKIKKTSFEIEHQQIQLQELQLQNVNLRNEIDELLKMLHENGLEIQETEEQLEKSNGYLQKLSLTFVEISNEIIRQQTLYKKSLIAPLEDSDYQNFIDESSSFNGKEIKDFLALGKSKE